MKSLRGVLLVMDGLLVLLTCLLWVARWQRSQARLIAHSEFYDGTSDIYLKVPGSIHLRNLTKHPATDTQPTWSPDGEWIAFVSGRDTPANSHPLHSLYVMRRNGSEMRRLGVSSPETGTRIITWSPDSRWIYSKYITRGWWDNYFVNVADWSSMTLRFENTFTVAAEWSPVEAWLAYRTEVTEGGTTIYRVHPAGHAKQTEPIIHSAVALENMVWSPDGVWLAYTTLENDHYRLYRIHVEEKQPQLIAEQDSLFTGVTWSRDSQHLAFADMTGENLYVMQADGTHQRRIVAVDDAYIGGIAWVGDALIYILQNRLAGEIYHLSLDENALPHRLFRVEDEVSTLNWSPDDSRIFFIVGSRSQGQLYQMKLDGSQVEYLTETAFEWEMPISPIIDLPFSVGLLLGMSVVFLVMPFAHAIIEKKF